jgi:hypothetical protein
MSSAPERLFLFLQCELPWALGPPDGRYLLRSVLDGEPERVIVLKTLGSRRAAEPARPTGSLGPGPFARRARSRRRDAPPEPEPAPVSVARATIVDPVSVSAERQAEAWLSELDPEREIPAAFAALNRLLYCYRLAAADPHAHELSPMQALAIRAGWGEGEQVADGVWLLAQELPFRGDGDRPRAGGQRVRRAPGPRTAALRPDEHLAGLLAAREPPLLCEELVLRARLDLEEGRTALAAIELDRALAAATRELMREQGVDLSERVDELRTLHAGVERAAQAVLGAAGDPVLGTAGDPVLGAAGASALDVESLRHALERLQAALRARAAAGFGRAD